MSTEILKQKTSWALWAIVAMTLGPLAVMPIASNANLAQQVGPAQYDNPSVPVQDAPMGAERAAV